MKRARKASTDATDMVVSAIKRTVPRTHVHGTFEVTRSTTEVLSRVKYVLDTGLEPLDGLCGGLPFGRLVEIYGLESSGKTATCIRAMIRAQMRHIYELVNEDGQLKKVRVGDDAEVVILYVDNEQSVDEGDQISFTDDQGQTAKLDVALARCDTVDQMFKMVDTVISKMADYQAKHKDKPCFVVIVVDTIAGTSSKEEITADWNKDDYQRQPKQLRSGFRRLQREINRHNVLMICTNQVSDKFQQQRKRGGNSFLPQDSDYSTFGGRAIKYYASLRVFVFQISQTYRLERKTRFSQGMLIGMFTAKNRLKKPFRHGRLVILLEGGLDNLYSKLETIVFLKLATAEKDGTLAFRFKAAAIEPTTFGAGSAADLEDEDDAEDVHRNRNPRCPSRAAWPQFYETHKADLDLLWQKSLDVAFGSNHGEIDLESDDEDDEDVIDLE